MSDKSKKGTSSKRRPEVPAIEWKEYPRIVPGEYRAFCKWGKQYRDPGFKKWLCQLKWDVFTENLVPLAVLPMFYSLGDSEKPRNPAGVGICRIGFERMEHHQHAEIAFSLASSCIASLGWRCGIESAAPYSVVCKIVEWETGSPRHSVNKSHSQDRQAVDREIRGF